jgi:hypothetical protein
MLNKSSIPPIFLLACLIANVGSFSSVMARQGQSNSFQTSLRDDSQEFIFAGHCPSGDAYRVIAYQLDVDGLGQSFYDYEGPAGKGTVQTNASPKKFVVRICHAQADINSGSKFD